MTKVTYICTKDNVATEVGTYAEAEALVAKNGGHFKAKYTPIPEVSAGTPSYENPKHPWYKRY